MVGFLYILAAFVVFIVAATIIFQWRMGKHRGVSREEFIAAFADAAVPMEIPAAVYDYYKRGVIWTQSAIRVMTPDRTGAPLGEATAYLIS